MEVTEGTDCSSNESSWALAYRAAPYTWLIGHYPFELLRQQCTGGTRWSNNLDCILHQLFVLRKPDVSLGSGSCHHLSQLFKSRSKDYAEKNDCYAVTVLGNSYQIQPVQESTSASTAPSRLRL